MMRCGRVCDRGDIPGHHNVAVSGISIPLVALAIYNYIVSGKLPWLVRHTTLRCIDASLSESLSFRSRDHIYRYHNVHLRRVSSVQVSG